MERFGRLTTEIKEWEILIKFQEKASSLSRVSQDLAKEAHLAKVEFTMYGEISNYKNIINQIRLKVLKRINPQSNLVSSPSNQNLNRVLQDELNISTTTIDPPNYQPTHGGDKVLNTYRLGLDLTAHDDQR